MNKRIFPLILAAAILFGTFGASASNADTADMDALAAVNNVNAYAIAFRRGNETTESMNCGTSSENAVYEVGSNGKMVAAYIMLKLVEEGKLALDSKVYLLLKEELLTDDSRLQDITVRHLLSHTGGFSPSFEFGVDRNIYFEPGTEFMYSGVGYIYLQSVIESVTGLPFEAAARKYVFDPLGMDSSTFESANTITPHMLSGTAVLFALLVFVASFAVLFIIGIVIRLLLRHRNTPLQRIFYIVFAASCVVNIGFLLLYPLAVLSKVVAVFAVYAIIAAAILFLSRNKRKLTFVGFFGYTALFIVLGVGLNTPIPVTGDLVPGEANAAYSMKSTGNDMAAFCDALLDDYNDGDSMIKDMFQPEVVIDGQNSWGLGLAIEDTPQGLTYWHSGINPGFQSLVVLHPASDSYVVVLTNSDHGMAFAKEAAARLLGVDGVWEITR